MIFTAYCLTSFTINCLHKHSGQKNRGKKRSCQIYIVKNPAHLLSFLGKLSLHIISARKQNLINQAHTQGSPNECLHFAYKDKIVVNFYNKLKQNVGIAVLPVIYELQVLYVSEYNDSVFKDNLYQNIFFRGQFQRTFSKVHHFSFHVFRILIWISFFFFKITLSVCLYSE